MAMVVRIGGLLALGLVVWTGCGTVLPTVPTPMPAVSVPSCPPNAGCGQGFAIGDRFYSFDCVRIRSNALQPAPHTTGNGVVEDVRGIVGLPTDAFLAVRGEIPCDEAKSSEWWIARADEISAEQLQSLSPRLGEVIKP